MNVLIIDDNEMSRTLLRSILSGEKHEIVGEAESVKQGLELALKLKPEMICLDIEMPDGSGIDLLKKITKQLPKTIVLMVTGKTDPQTQRECLAKGARGVIVKPFSAPAVSKAVKDAMHTSNAQATFRDLRENKESKRESNTRIAWLHISNYKIVTRLSVGFGIVTLLTILTGLTGGWGLHSSSETTDRMVSQSLTKERLITEWRYDTALNGTRAMAVAKNVDAAQQEALAPKIKETSSRITEIQKQLDGMSKSTAEAAIYEEIAKKRSDYIAARDEVFATKKSGNEDEAKKQTDMRLEPALDSYVAAIQNLSKLQSEEIARSTNDIGNQFANSETVLGALTVIAVLVSLALAMAINRSISRPLQEAINVSKAVSRGDLSTITISLDGKDELCELLWALKHMHENLGVLVGQVRTGADTIADAAVQIAEGGVNLSSRTEQQAGSLEETASTMEELTSTVKQNADNARDASQLAVSASEVAVKGGVVVSEVVGMMGSINESSKKIADIISVIDSIAFQTNILALNAAVEAARAGEQGRGFAVVAAEVRTLAQRSASAAKEIKALIDDSVNKVEDGSKLVDQAGATMDEIVASIRRVTDIVSEISTASQEQSSGIEQIGSAIVQLDEMTQQNSQLVEDSLMSTKRLQEQATGLVGVVKSFKLHRNYETTADALVQKNSADTPKSVGQTVKIFKPKTIAVSPSARKPIHSPARVSNDAWEEF